jgi:RHS repeat-associated protein
VRGLRVGSVLASDSNAGGDNGRARVAMQQATGEPWVAMRRGSGWAAGSSNLATGGVAPVWAELDGNNRIQARYLSKDALDAVFARLAAGSSGGVTWNLTDRLGSVRGVMNNSGQLVNSLSYDAFGVSSVTAPGGADRFRYAGYQYDAATGLYYVGARWYDPSQGRWLSQDPLGLAADSNPYRYVSNTPTNALDPTGTELINIRDQVWAGFVRGYVQEAVLGVLPPELLPLALAGVAVNLPREIWVDPTIGPRQERFGFWDAVSNAWWGFLTYPFQAGWEGVREVWDVGNAIGTWLSVLGHEWLGTGVYLPPLQSDLFRGYEEAIQRGEGERAGGYLANVLTLGGYGLYQSAEAGDWGAFWQQVGSYGWWLVPGVVRAVRGPGVPRHLGSAAFEEAEVVPADRGVPHHLHQLAGEAILSVRESAERTNLRLSTGVYIQVMPSIECNSMVFFPQLWRTPLNTVGSDQEILLTPLFTMIRSIVWKWSLTRRQVKLSLWDIEETDDGHMGINHE